MALGDQAARHRRTRRTTPARAALAGTLLAATTFAACSVAGLGSGGPPDTTALVPQDATSAAPVPAASTRSPEPSRTRTPVSRSRRSPKPSKSPKRRTPKPTARPQRTAAPQVPATGLTAREAAVLRLTNAARVDHGCRPLHVDTRLTRAARGHASDMVRRHYFEHTSPDGSTPSDRAREAGFRSGVGENIATGYPTASAVMKGWLKSPGHRANILNCSYTVIGIGYDPGRVSSQYGGGTWVQDFGRR